MKSIFRGMKSSKGGRSVLGKWGRWNLSQPFVFLLCITFFLVGFFGSTLLSRQDEWSASPRLKPRLLNSVDVYTRKGDIGFVPLPHGVSGEGSISSIPFQVLSWTPRVVYFPNFATADQCISIIDMAKPELQPSSLALRSGETKETTKGIRTSSGMFISSSEDKTGVLGAIEDKIAKATMFPRSHGEAYNILRYEIGQRYLAHYDAFNPAEYGPQKSQRVASFLLYLSDVDEGGETMFPFENGMNMDIGYDYQECIGLKVRPRRGDGVLFYSVFSNGTIDLTSLHGSCPVIKGEKWVATKWIRNQIQED